MTKQSQSKEAQRQARITAAYRSLRETANRDGQPSHRAFSVASQSDPTVHYTVTWDTDTDALHCSCTAGSYERDCIHKAAMRRYVSGFRVSEQEREAERAARRAEQARIDTALLRRDNRPFSERFMR